ncbi:hypothetical protein GTA08_BOTSDO04277 [Neofusicoccum parvum]|uniref:Uncharacterized protein n=1 Tax=Neofusicoccum parvum TaxID=310453 RepID=A0ACB5SEX2_9PEZI|nr:hypothetical protein GTA08_BOTSDO04277 [Neofusicoccum parvum]
MRPLPNTPGGKFSRFSRIARDLAGLPVELIEPVIATLSVDAVARLALHDTPRTGVTWAIEHSPTWAPWFAHRAAALAALVAVSDALSDLRLRAKTPKEHDLAEFVRVHTPNRWGFYYTPPANDPDWGVNMGFLYADAGTLRRAGVADGEVLVESWAKACREVVRPVAQNAARDAAELARFLAAPEDAAAFLELVDALSCPVDASPAVKVEDVARFVELHHRACEARAVALARQLRRLAELYERHPTRVKQPFAPQTRRVNEEHVPRKMRTDARKLEQWHPLIFWRRPSRYRFIQAFPNLVPYDWCLRLFVRVLDEHPLPREREKTVYPSNLVATIQEAIGGLPYFYDRSGGTMDQTLVESLRMPPADDGKAVFLTMRVSNNYLPYADAELKWLEAFIESVAWMEQRFSEFVHEVRGKEWSEGNADERQNRAANRNAKR